MPRNPEQNAEVRKARKAQILDAALTVCIRLGYHGTDMDVVALEAGLAKGLIYYYYKTKNALFTELYTQMWNKSYAFSAALLDNSSGMNPVEQLMAYTHGIFAENILNPRMMQFAMRVPFDAYAIFGADGWKEGAQKSDLHRKALTSIIDDGVKQGSIPETNPSAAANSFWSVFVANVFEYSKMIMGTPNPAKIEPEVFRGVVRFCFQGLGIEYDVWNSCLERIIEKEYSDENL